MSATFRDSFFDFVVFLSISFCLYYLYKLDDNIDCLKHDLKTMKAKIHLNDKCLNDNKFYYLLYVLKNKTNRIREDIEIMQDDIDVFKSNEVNCCCNDNERPVCEPMVDYL